MSGVINIEQVRCLQGLECVVKVEDIVNHEDFVEVRGRYMQRGWTMGTEIYVWLSEGGRMMANAVREMEDGKAPPRASEISMRKTICVAHVFPLGGEPEEFKDVGFFTGSKNFGLVPQVRQRCMEMVRR